MSHPQRRRCRTAPHGARNGAPGGVRRALAGLAVASLALLVAACDNNKPVLLQTTDEAGGESITGVVDADSSAAVRVPTGLCVTRRGASRVLEVTPVNPSDNFSLPAYAVQSFEPGAEFAVEDGSLPDVGVDPIKRTVSVICDKGGPYPEVVLQVVRTGAGPITADGFELRWDTPTDSGTLTLDTPLALQ